MDQLENDLLFTNCIVHVLTNVHDRSQNGPKLVTNDHLVWSHTFIIHVITSNIVMWETQHNIADLDCFKTLILVGVFVDSKSTSEGVLYFRKSHVRSNKLDVQETDFCFKQFGSEGNEILQLLNPRDRERESHPCVNLHREKWFLQLP